MNTTNLDPRGLPHGAALKGNEISPRDAAALLKDNPGKALLIDVRTKAEWDVARVAGAVHVPIDELEGRLHELPLDEAEHITLLCYRGSRSLKGADLLKAKGYPGAKSIFGGIELWSQAVDAGVPRYDRNPITGACSLRK